MPNWAQPGLSRSGLDGSKALQYYAHWWPIENSAFVTVSYVVASDAFGQRAVAATKDNAQNCKPSATNPIRNQDFST
jgi:hypothetical protein